MSTTWSLTRQSKAAADALLQTMPTGDPRTVYPTQLISVATVLGLKVLLRDGVEPSLSLQQQVRELCRRLSIPVSFDEDGSLSEQSYKPLSVLANEGHTRALNDMLGARIQAQAERVSAFLRALDLPISIAMNVDGGWVARMNTELFVAFGREGERLEGHGPYPLHALVALHDSLVGLQIVLKTLAGKDLTIPTWPRLESDDALNEILSDLGLAQAS